MTKILFHSESTHLKSGFAKYYQEVMMRLKDKYDIAEFAMNGTVECGQDRPWKYYANAVRHDDPRLQTYASNPEHRHGSWRFDRVLMHFQPDIVAAILDPWMMSFHEQSPLRRHFHRIIMPTVDSAPQQDAWLENFTASDSLFTYNDWGKEVLERDGLTVNGVAPPATDPDVYKPLNFKQCRDEFGLLDDVIIIGTIMHNQPRKLFPDIFETFRKVLDGLPKHLKNQVFLYAHTSFPDLAGWNIPFLLNKYGVGNNVLFTYVCHDCGKFRSFLFRDARTMCPYCGGHKMWMTKSGKGLDEPSLVKLINCFNAYLQMATAAGHEMPIPEAASCGVKPFAMDVAAMSDVTRKCNGELIDIAKNFLDFHLKAYRSYPDTDHAAKLLLDFIQQPVDVQRQQGFKCREAYMGHYSWDKTAKVWEDYIDNLELTNTWNDPADCIQVPKTIPNNISPLQLIRWCLEWAKKPQAIGSYAEQVILNKMNFGVFEGNGVIRSFSPEEFYQQSVQGAKVYNEWELIRTGQIKLPEEDYLKVNE